MLHAALIKSIQIQGNLSVIYRRKTWKIMQSNHSKQFIWFHWISLLHQQYYHNGTPTTTKLFRKNFDKNFFFIKWRIQSCEWEYWLKGIEQSRVSEKKLLQGEFVIQSFTSLIWLLYKPYPRRYFEFIFFSKCKMLINALAFK